MADLWQLNSASLHIQTVNLWETLSNDAWQWAESFCAIAGSRSFGKKIQPYLLGYSLGGRMGLHGLIQQPDLWAGAVIVSADPGSSDEQKRALYLERDRTWANRFLNEPWDDLLAEWDQLPVFCGRPCTVPRPESVFDRHKIAHAFEAYSKGKMDYLTPHLSRLSLPITYVTGGDDHRYGQIGRTLAAECPNVTHIEIPDAGHRVPWEQPEAFLEVLIHVLTDGDEARR
ncbi:MAG: alpha/beta fold hydrolase [Cyanobacteria bacterium P01_D01_bin.56]